jgi:hypothetical protein
MKSFIFQNKFENLGHLVGFIISKFVTMHVHMNVKIHTILCQYRATDLKLKQGVDRWSDTHGHRQAHTHATFTSYANFPEDAQ